MKAFSPSMKEPVYKKVLRLSLGFIHRVLRGVANNMLDKDVIRPREFSNAMLRYYAPLFTGSVVNISGWKDGDFENSMYKTYFPNATMYAVSNAPTSSKGVGSLPDELLIDLSTPVDASFHKKFDVVFNHTTLEHIFELDIAFANLCDMSRDTVILVVPTLQHIHFNDGFGDYNRLTPMGIAKYFEKNGFEVQVLRSNEQQFSPLYCFAIASRPNSKYKEQLEKNIDFSMGGALYGSPVRTEHINAHVNI